MRVTTPLLLPKIVFLDLLIQDPMAKVDHISDQKAMVHADLQDGYSVQNKILDRKVQQHFHLSIYFRLRNPIAPTYHPLVAQCVLSLCHRFCYEKGIGNELGVYMNET